MRPFPQNDPRLDVAAPRGGRPRRRARDTVVRHALRATCALLLALAAAMAGAGTPVSVTPDGPIEPRRVVALEFLETEVALALELPVVGVADRQAYKRWVGVAAERLSEARDIGGRAEPSLEQLIRLRPDLIVGSTWRHGAIAARLQAIAPTVLYRDLPRPSVTDQYSRMRAIVRDLGARTGRERAAAALLDELDEALAAGRERLAGAGLGGAPVVLGQLVPGSDRIRLFTRNSLAARIARELGLAPGWDAPPEDYGFRAVEIGRLAELPEGVHLVLQADPDGARFRRLTAHPAWPELEPVKSGRFHRIDPDTWLFGGPLSAMRLADRLAASLSRPSP